MVVNNCGRCTDVFMVTCYLVCFMVEVGVLLVSDKIEQWNIVKCLVKLELYSDISSVLERVCEKESWHKTGFCVVKWFGGAKQDVTFDKRVCHPASRTSLNVKNVTEVVKNYFWFYCSEDGITEGNTGSVRLWQNMYLNIGESLGHYGLKNPAQAKTENSDFLNFTAKMLKEFAFGKRMAWLDLVLSMNQK